MSAVFTGTIAKSLTLTLNKVIDDPTDNVESSALYKQWLDVQSMSDNWVEDLEMGGPGLIAEKTEGAPISTGTIYEGYSTRYLARTFARKLIVTEEALEDNKYDLTIRAAKRLKRALWKTVDVDTTYILIRAFNAAYVAGDGLCLANAAHTLPGGGTFSNTLAVPLSPSRAAVITITSAIRKLPGHDGVTEGYQPKKIVCPTEQWAVWEGLTLSEKAPEAGQFNEINVVNRLGLKVVPNHFWNNTTTNWGVITDCDSQLNLKWRRKPRSRTWVDNGQELMNYAISARWARGWSDPRAFYGVEA